MLDEEGTSILIAMVLLLIITLMLAAVLVARLSALSIP